MGEIREDARKTPRIYACASRKLQSGLRICPLSAVLCALSSNPSLQFAHGELPDHQHARRAVIETGNGGEILSPITLEDMGVLDRDLFQRLEAIGGKSGCDHGDMTYSPLGEASDRCNGRGFEPFAAPEASLKCHDQLGLVH